MAKRKKKVPSDVKFEYGIILLKPRKKGEVSIQILTAGAGGVVRAANTDEAALLLVEANQKMGRLRVADEVAMRMAALLNDFEARQDKARAKALKDYKEAKKKPALWVPK